MWASTLALLGFVASSTASVIPRQPEGPVFELKIAPTKRTDLSILTQFEWDPYVLTNVCLDCVRPSTAAKYNCSVKFDWFDPNSVRQNNITSTTCNATWLWDGKSVIGGDDNSLDTPYDPCYRDDATYFAMRLMTFYNPGNFTLQLAHQYHDSENFTAPWDYPTTFAEPTFGLPLVEKSDNHIKHYTKGVVNGTIMGVSG